MSLNPTFRLGALDLTDYPFSVAFGSDRGSPEAIVADVQSSLSDGSLTRITKYDNRTITLPIVVEGATQAELANNEALLVAEARLERNQFTFNPGDGTAPDSVFDTFTADLVPVYDDDTEIAMMRRYELTLEAHPWARSATKTITPAITGVAPTVIDSGSATTNWSIIEPAGATLSVVSGAVRSTYNPGTIHANGQYGSALQRTATISTATNKYISVDWKSSISSYYGLQTSANLWPGTEVRREPGAVAGFTRSWFRIPDSVTSLAWIRFATTHPASTGSATLEVDLVQSANALPSQGTGRQNTATILPGGSVSAQGDVVVQHATSTLGRTIVYTHPIHPGYSPPLRPWRAGGPTVISDPNQVSGAYDDIPGAATYTYYNVPIDTLPPGSAHLWVKMSASSTAAVRINWSVSAWQGGFVQADSRQSGSVLISAPTAGPTYLFPIARMTLPPSRVTGPVGYAVFTIEKDPSSSAIALGLDEAWVFAMDKGMLSVVDCGTGSPVSGQTANRLRITAPSIDAPHGGLLVATAADWSDSWEPAGPAILCDQREHKFDPDGSMIFTVTSNALNAAVSLEHYRRWHSNAGS